MRLRGTGIRKFYLDSWYTLNQVLELEVNKLSDIVQ
jgi:hypothetical protein